MNTLLKLLLLGWLLFDAFLFPKIAFADWPTFRFDNKHSGAAPYSVGDSPQIKWISPNLSTINNPGVVDSSGNIYLPTINGLISVDSNGNKRWTFPYLISNSPAIGGDGNIYFSNSGCNPYVYSVSPSGQKIWDYDLRQNRGQCGHNQSNAPITFSSDKSTFYVGVDYFFDGLMAFNLDGSIKWASSLGGYNAPRQSSVAVMDNGNLAVGSGGNANFYIFSPDGKITSYGRAASGQTVELFSPVIDSDNNIYTVSWGAYNGEVLRSSTQTGIYRWQYKTPTTFFPNLPALKGQTIYAVEKNNLLALNTQNGQIFWRWTSPFSSADLTAPVIDKNGIIYTSQTDQLLAINSSGALKWSLTLQSTLGPPILAEDNLLYIYRNSNNKGYLYAIGTTPPKTPLIFIPGIGGSEFKTKQEINWSAADGHGGTFSHTYSAGEKVWVNEVEAAKPGNDDYFDILRLRADGQTAEADLELTGELFKGAYQGTIDYFITQGYVLNQNLFVFPYDWRKDLSLTAPLLDQKIEDIKKQTNSQKVDLVAHSMGGLVSRNYITDPARALKVRKLINLGTPHLGAVKFLKSLRYGDCLFLELGPFCFTLAPSELKDVIQNIPGGFELAPSQTYFDFYSGEDNLHPFPVRDDRDIDNNNITGPLNYLQTKQLLSDLGHNTALFSPSESFHALDNNLTSTNNVEVSIIAGSGIPTLGQIVEKNLIDFAGLKIPHRDELKINGDGTVPLLSASLTDPHKNLSLNGNAKVYYTNQKHENLPSSGPALDLALSLLSNLSDLPTGISTQPYQLNGVQFSVHSPVNLHVYDQNNNHTGPTADDNFDTNIPDSFYDTLDDAKFIWVPASGQYTLKFEATDQGSFDFKIRNFAEGINNQTILYHQILLTPSTKAEVVLNTSLNESPILNVDNDNNGTVDSQIPATAVLTGSAVFDQTPPATSIEISGEKADNDQYLDQVTVTLNAQDDTSGSGIAKTEYSLDNGQTVNIYSQPLTISVAGTTSLQVKSTDQAGNEEDPQKQEIKISKKTNNNGSSVNPSSILSSIQNLIPKIPTSLNNPTNQSDQSEVLGASVLNSTEGGSDSIPERIKKTTESWFKQPLYAIILLPGLLAVIRGWRRFKK